MKEISIIIDGVQFDAVKSLFPCDCYGCDLANYCLNTGHGTMACSELIGDNRIFKRKTE